MGRGLLRGAINTQLSQNLLSPPFQISALANFAIKFKHVNVLIYSAGPRSIGAERKETTEMSGGGEKCVLEHSVIDSFLGGEAICPELAANLFGGEESPSSHENVLSVLSHRKYHGSKLNQEVGL